MHESFISLLKNYKAEDETICQIIGFKFQSLNQQETKLQSQKDTTDTSTINSTSKNQAIDQQTLQDFNFFQSHHLRFKNSHLYTVAAYLLKYNMIDLDLLMPHVNQYEIIIN